MLEQEIDTKLLEANDEQNLDPKKLEKESKDLEIELERAKSEYSRVQNEL